MPKVPKLLGQITHFIELRLTFYWDKRAKTPVTKAPFPLKMFEGRDKWSLLSHLTEGLTWPSTSWPGMRLSQSCCGSCQPLPGYFWEWVDNRAFHRGLESSPRVTVWSPCNNAAKLNWSEKVNKNLVTFTSYIYTKLSNLNWRRVCTKHFMVFLQISNNYWKIKQGGRELNRNCLVLV